MKSKMGNLNPTITLKINDQKALLKGMDGYTIY